MIGIPSFVTPNNLSVEFRSGRPCASSVFSDSDEESGPDTLSYLGFEFLGYSLGIGFYLVTNDLR